MPKSLDELMAEYEPERLAEIARNETPEAIARRDAKRKAEVEREIGQGLRDADGNWVELPDDPNDYDDGDADEGAED